MLGQFHPAGRDDQRNGGGDVEAVHAIAAGAAHIQRIGGTERHDGAGAQGTGRGDDFASGFATIRHGGEESAERIIVHLAIENGGKGLGGRAVVQRA